MACHKAPFDHPSLVVSTRHKPADAGGGLAADVLARLPAVGSGGLANCNAASLNKGDLFQNAAERTVLQAATFLVQRPVVAGPCLREERCTVRGAKARALKPALSGA